ncbi:MAG TPA: zinc-binding dehydrogenase [Bacteroidales bacterium]|nr:zinc-binding dehydrogenase [Bacteroidales bacterium]
MTIKRTKAVVLPLYNDNLIRALLGLKIEEREIPELKPDEVLIKLGASPCNPSDIAFLRGGYNIVKPIPVVPGFEAMGEVVETGTEAQHLINKKVSCFSQEDSDGTWAEYFRAKAKDCIVLKDGIKNDQAACLSINPLTALGMFELVEKAGNVPFVLNAAGGQVPVFMRVLAAEKGIEVINIVRKEEQVEQLRNAGQKMVLNSTAEDFSDQLAQACNTLNPLFAFDAVAGEISGQMLNSLPEEGTLVIYGGLSGQSVSGIDTMGVIFKRKKVIGFNLNEWIAEMDENTFKEQTDHVQDLFIEEKFKTQIQGSYKLEDVVTGIRAYIKSMSAGKILLKGDL